MQFFDSFFLKCIRDNLLETNWRPWA